MKNASTKYFHAFKINIDNCTGCTRCVSVCVTEALRVRKGKVVLDTDRCIDCGRCIEACRYNALLPISDSIEQIKSYKYKIAIIPTTYAGQFSSEIGYAKAKKSLYKLGFDEVAEEAMVTGIMNRIIRDYTRKQKIRPIISSHCPAIVRLVQLKYTSLLPNMLYIESPVSTLAMYLRDSVARKQNLKQEDIGIFLVAHCVAEVTAVHQPEGASARFINGAIASRDMFKDVVGKVKEVDDNAIELFNKGLNWAIAMQEGEAVADGDLNVLSVSGLNNVCEILTRIENQQFHEPLDFVVLRSCTAGCVGGNLNIENPFVAAARINRYLREGEYNDKIDTDFLNVYKMGGFDVLPLEPRPILLLDDDIKQALAKMKKIKAIVKQLPGLDCSACGSPSCQALAEDIVAGNSILEDCVVLFQKTEKK